MRAYTTSVLMMTIISIRVRLCETETYQELSRAVILHSPRETNWGTWSEYFSTCTNGTVVVGMQLKTDPFHGNHHDGLKADNTALNGVKFFCSKSYRNSNNETSVRPFNPQKALCITNEVQKWGKWGANFICSNGYAEGFQLRSLKPLKNGAGYGFKFDDVGACNLRLYCSNGEILEGDGRNEWGRWTKTQKCPRGQAICSLQTQIESDQFIFDNTALNNIDVGCCSINTQVLQVSQQDSEFTENNLIDGAQQDSVSITANKNSKKSNLIKLKLKMMTILQRFLLPKAD